MLAAGALVASILAVGAAPAAAAPAKQQPDAPSEWLACVGAAKAGNDFTDVSMDSVHYDSISCLAYYGITTGKTADTYDPQSSVTRSQMALFLTRAADKAGIDLGDAMDVGFTDLGMSGADRVAAINVLASKGIMPGRTATTFDPEGLVTRADMAQHLFTLLDLALDSIHIDTLPESVDNDGTGIELNVSGGSGDRPNDYFGDVRRTQPVHVADMINAVYELGVTTGTNGMTGDMGTFEPEANVTRAQMASFIMRALGHTNLRPSGLTVQQTENKTQISVRGADFAPVVGQQVELISSSYPEDAFDRSGSCITDPAYVKSVFTTSDGSVITGGFDTCSIDLEDEATNAEGNVEFAVGSLSGSRTTITCAGTGITGFSDKFQLTGEPGAPDTVWAWQGDLHDTVGRDTELVKPVSGNAGAPASAESVIISGGSRSNVKMGQTLTYTIQLVDGNRMPVGPNPNDVNDFRVTIAKNEEQTAGDGTYNSPVFRDTKTYSPDGSGLITIKITNPDPKRFGPNGPDSAADTRSDPDVQVSVTVAGATGNTLTLIDQTAGTSTPTTGVLPDVVFSDNASAVTSVSATSSTRWRLLSTVTSRNRNTVSVEVSDQYGNPYGGNGNTVVAAGSNVAWEASYSLPSSGRRSINYTYTGTAAGQQDITVTVNDSDGNPIAGVTDTTSVQWADAAGAPADSAAAVAVLVGDPRMDSIVVTGPLAYSYGSDDRFFVEGTQVTLAQFEEVLGSATGAPTATIRSLGSLEWRRYDPTRPRDGATFELTSLQCAQSPS